MRAGAYCKCLACGHVGHAYGAPTSNGVPCGWCQKCGVNDHLVEIEDPRKKQAEKAEGVEDGIAK